MKTVLTVGAVVGAALIAFLIGRGVPPPAPPGGAPPWVDGALFQVPRMGADGFCETAAGIRNLRGRAFVWVRRGGCTPAAGGYFELRPKPGNASPLEPANPRGVNLIVAAAPDNVAEGTRYHYELWQVNANGDAKMLIDPEIEIGPPPL